MVERCRFVIVCKGETERGRERERESDEKRDVRQTHVSQRGLGAVAPPVRVPRPLQPRPAAIQVLLRSTSNTQARF